MEQEHNTVEIGHPITNMLMRQAQNADMGAADHVDGAGVDLVDPADLVEQVKREVGLRGVTGPVTAPAVSGHVTVQGDPLEVLAPAPASVHELPAEAQAAFLEIENLVEGARDAIVMRLEQFDEAAERLARVEAGLERLLSHFGLVNSGS